MGQVKSEPSIRYKRPGGGGNFHEGKNLLEGWKHLVVCSHPGSLVLYPQIQAEGQSEADR